MKKLINKPRGTKAGKTTSPLTRLKILWLTTLSETDKDYWRGLFLSDTTVEDIRGQISAKLNINLTYDKQVRMFREWEFQQQEMDLERQRQAEDEKRLTEEFGNRCTLDQIRLGVLRKSYARSAATGDFKQGLATSKEHRGWFNARTSREKFEFAAAKACLDALPQLQAVHSQSKLSDEEKAKAIQRILFPPSIFLN